MTKEFKQWIVKKPFLSNIERIKIIKIYDINRILDKSKQSYFSDTI